MILPALSRCEADELYWSEVDLARYEAPWAPHCSRLLVDGMAAYVSLLALQDYKRPPHGERERRSQRPVRVRQR